MEDKDKVLSFDREFSSVSDSIENTKDRVQKLDAELSETSSLMDEILREMSEIPNALVPIPAEQSPEEACVLELNSVLEDISDPSLKGDFRLSATDVLVAIISGVIASVIDILLVGSPEVVKIYRAGGNFDGSILTAALREIGNGDGKLSEMLKWLSDGCKVPYDLPTMKGVVYPDNHRLRCFAHDPVFGLLFAVADIILGTATLVDDEGRIRVVPRSANYPVSMKYLSVLYYLGHLLSDVCTARGLPIPGFITTQFFANLDKGASIAETAELMYRDGYDLRHLASMSTPVIVKNTIIDVYLRFFTESRSNPIETIAERQIRENRQIAYKYRLRLVSDAVGCGGNVLKFFIPPTSGNPTALNLPEWTALLKDSIREAKYQLRDKTVETALFNREIISDNWRMLLES